MEPLLPGDLTGAISAAMVELYGRFYGHDRTTATTYINDNIGRLHPQPRRVAPDRGELFFLEAPPKLAP